MASIRRRKKGDPKSPWVVTYTDPATGKRHMATPKSGLQKDADKLRRKIEAEIESGLHTAKVEGATLQAVCEAFLHTIEMRVRDNSISGGRLLHYRTVFLKHLIPALGARKIDKVTCDEVERFYDGLLKNGIATNTARQYMAACITLEKFATKRGYTKVDPFADYMRERPKGEVEKVRVFTTPEVRRLLIEVAKRPPCYQQRNQAFWNCLVNIAAFCGLRRGEILALTRANVDLETGFLRVRHNLNRFDVLKGPKTRSGIRDVPIPRHVASLLHDWIKKHAVPDNRGLIFRTPKGYAFISGNINSRWQDLLVRTGLPKLDDEGRTFHIHSLRHFAASYMIECGWSLPLVASMLGHSTFDMTLQTYAHAVAGGRQRSERMQAMAMRLLEDDEVEPPKTAPPAIADATNRRQTDLTI